MDSTSEGLGGDFLLCSPGYRIEKARLRYENLLLSLDDDSVDDAERLILEDESKGTGFESSYDNDFGRGDSFHDSQLESKQSSHETQGHLSKSPVTDIYKSVTKRYVIDHSHSSTTNAMAKKSRRQAPTRYNHNVSFQDNNKELTDEWADITESTGENATQRSTGTLHENDDIIIAQQSEIEMLKYELNELKMSSSKEISTLVTTNRQLQTSLDKERESYLKELTACKSELATLKSLQKSTKDELDVDKETLNQALRKLERITKRSQALHTPADNVSFSYVTGKHHNSHHRHHHSAEHI